MFGRGTLSVSVFRPVPFAVFFLLCQPVRIEVEGKKMCSWDPETHLAEKMQGRRLSASESTRSILTPSSSIRSRTVEEFRGNPPIHESQVNPSHTR